MDERRTNTREQIRTIALELFARRGYAGTSLREIAERLGVTKAAVYYHFRTKEEILTSLIEDFLAQLDELVTWAGEQPPGPATRGEVLRRYAALLGGRTTELARFVQEGQPAIRELAAGLEIRKRFRLLVDALAGPGADAEATLRAEVALVALHLGAVTHREGEAGRRTAALRIALETTAAAP